MSNQMKFIKRLAGTMAAVSLVMSAQAFAQSSDAPATPPAHWGAVSINMEEIEYPYPVHFLHRNLYGQDVRIAYMDAAPTGPANGQTIVLLHGSSYYGLYWGEVMETLTAAGYRAIAIDRLGWGKSSKPIIPYDVNLHTSNINAIIEKLGIDEIVIAGHSLGGRVASHFAHSYPDKATHLVMVNPIALNDSDRGRQWSEPSGADAEPDLQAIYASNLRQEQNRIVNWTAENLEHVRIRYGYALSSEYHRLTLVRSMNNNLTAQPVDTYFPKITIPALLIGGAQDGPNYPETAQRAVDLLPNGELYMIPNAGHNPHEETPEELSREMLRFLSGES